MSANRPVRFFRTLALAVVLWIETAWADRIAYHGARDIVAHSATITVRHHHDWSRIPPSPDGQGWALRYSLAQPFGVDQATSSLEIQSRRGPLVARVPSPPLTYLVVSSDGRYVIGLSSIKFLNSTQLVVYAPSGELLLRRRIAAEVFCFAAADYERFRRKHRDALQQIASRARSTYGTLGWREGDRVFLDHLGSVDNVYFDAMWEDLHPRMCKSPLSPNFGESTTNSVYWYHATDPRPRVIEKNGRPFEVRLRDPKGVEFSVKFERTPLEPTDSDKRAHQDRDTIGSYTSSCCAHQSRWPQVERQPTREPACPPTSSPNSTSQS